MHAIINTTFGRQVWNGSDLIIQGGIGQESDELNIPTESNSPSDKKCQERVQGELSRIWNNCLGEGQGLAEILGLDTQVGMASRGSEEMCEE